MEKAKELIGYDGIFAQRLRTLMKGGKITQAKLAENLGISRQAVSTYTDGSVLPNLQNLQKICMFFNVPSDYLMGFTISTSSDIDERKISDIIGLDSIAVERLKELQEADNETAKNILWFLNAFLFSRKPLEQLADTFLKRFEIHGNYNKAEKRFREIQKNELNDKTLFEHEEAIALLENLDKYKKDIRWLTFLSAEYLDVIFDIYTQNTIEYQIEKRCNNAKTNE